MRASLRGWLAFLLLVGTIVGVGMFAIPFVFAGVGLLVGLGELVVIALVAVLVHLAYAEVVLATDRPHHLPGYVRLYLGERAGLLSRLSYLFGLSGTLLAYLVLGGTFLGEIFRWLWPGALPALGPLAFYVLGTAVVFRSIRFESVINALFTLALVVAIVILSVTLLPSFSAAALRIGSPGAFFAPYGVLLFAMSGAAIIPEMRRVLGRSAMPRLPHLVIGGTAAAALLYLIFATAVLGASGADTTPDAIRGLALRFGDVYLLGGSIIGFLAAITSFIAIGVVLEGMFATDMQLPRRSAWTLTAAIPAGLYLLGLRNFIEIVSVIGAVGIGVDSIFILFLERAVRRVRHRTLEFRLRIPGAVRLALVVMLGLGVLLELGTFFSG